MNYVNHGRPGLNLLCVVDDKNFGQLLPDMKIKDEALNFLMSQSLNETSFLGVGFHKLHVPFNISKGHSQTTFTAIGGREGS